MACVPQPTAWLPMVTYCQWRLVCGWIGLPSRRLVAHDGPGVHSQVERVSNPYIGAQRLWYESLHIGADTGGITTAVTEQLARHELIRP